MTFALDWSEGNLGGSAVTYGAGTYLDFVDKPAGATASLTHLANRPNDSNTLLAGFAIETTGSSMVTFDYKAHTESYDKLSVYLDGALQVQFGNVTTWSAYSGFAIPSAGMHTIEFRYIKDSSSASGEDRVRIANLYVTNTVTTAGAPDAIDSYDFESGSIPTPVSTTSWVNSTIDALSGTRSLRTPTSTAHSTSYDLTITKPASANYGAIRFKYAVGCEPSSDGFAIWYHAGSAPAGKNGDFFFTSPTGGTVVSGDIALILPSSASTILLRYYKDSSFSAAPDAVWIDDLRITALAPTSVGIGQVIETGSAFSIAGVTNQSISIGIAQSVDLAQSIIPPMKPWIPSKIDLDVQAWNRPFGSVEIFMEKVLETQLAQPMVAMFDQFVAIDQAVETDVAFSLPFPQSRSIDQTTESESTASVTPQLVVTASIALTGSGSVDIASESISFTPVYALMILDPVLNNPAPTSLTFILTGASPGELYLFTFDDDTSTVYAAEADSSGSVGPASITVPIEHGAIGTHTLRATRVAPEVIDAGIPSSIYEALFDYDGGSSTTTGTIILDGGTPGTSFTDLTDIEVASAEFLLTRAPAASPTTMGADAQAVALPGAISHDTRHWVFQDLLGAEDGGIGSFILPRNPREMTSPHLEHVFNSRHTTAITGRHHVFQTAMVPHEWTFTGLCFTQEQQEAMEAFRNLNRRFYIIDHRNRAWKCIIQNMEFTPRLRTNFNGVLTDWASEYTCTAIVLDQNWVTPA